MGPLLCMHNPEMGEDQPIMDGVILASTPRFFDTCSYWEHGIMEKRSDLIMYHIPKEGTAPF